MNCNFSVKEGIQRVVDLCCSLCVGGIPIGDS